MDVFLWDGTQVGKVDRIVIDPVTAQITDLVVHKGHFFTEDRVVPLGAVSRTDEGSVVLEQRYSAENLALFKETHYIPVDEATRAQRGLPPDAVLWTSPLGGGPDSVMLPSEGNLIRETSTNTPEGSVAVEVGSPVLAADGAHVGRVDEMITDPGSDRMSHLVVERGLIDRQRRAVPASWVEVLTEREVRLAVSADAVDKLPLFVNQGTPPPSDA
jgi:uncharacterized protein YrrD